MKVIANRVLDIFIGVDKTEYQSAYIYSCKPKITKEDDEIEFSVEQEENYCELLNSDMKLLSPLFIEKGKCYKAKIVIIEDVTDSLEEKEEI